MKIQRFSVFLTTDDGMIEAEARPSEFGVSVGLHYNKDNRSQYHNSVITDYNEEPILEQISKHLIMSEIIPDAQNMAELHKAVLLVKSLAKLSLN